jgi:hypothetical protein
LGDLERHRLVFVQETGGFSLRCIDGMKELRQSYQDWKGESIVAKRAQLRGESRDLPIPVHLQKEPPFWDVFPEDPAIFSLVVQARALGVLRQEENRTTKETVIRYTRQTAIGAESVDIASSWEEASQVLEVLACRPDREEIQRQVMQKLNAAETPAQKQAVFGQLTRYLEQRALELDKQGGKDSPDYKREARILLDVIERYKLKVESQSVSPGVVQQPPSDGGNAPTQIEAKSVTPQAHVFCTNCGTKNPSNSKFCFKCGTQLVKLN